MHALSWMALVDFSSTVALDCPLVASYHLSDYHPWLRGSNWCNGLEVSAMVCKIEVFCLPNAME